MACELECVSSRDHARYEDTGINWRVRRGYGALMAAYGASCPLALNCEVTLIDHSPQVRIETSLGTLTANKAIVTVPTNLIANEAIRFTPRCRQRSMPRSACRSAWPTRCCWRWTSRKRCRRTAICAAPPCAPRWAAIICARSGRPASKAISAALCLGAGRRRRPAPSPRKASTRSQACLATTIAAN